MEDKPGISWGTGNYNKIGDIIISSPCRINLMRSSKGWLAIYYDDKYSKGEIIKIFNPKSITEYRKMFETLGLWNYGTCELCPYVKLEMDKVG